MPGDQRGLLKPKLSWPGAAKAPVSKPAPAKTAPAPPAKASGAAPKGAPSNAIPMQQYTMEQLQKMAASRGLTVNKLVAQMVEQYLKESPEEPGA